MKRMIAITFVILLLLTSCGTTPADTTPVVTTPADTTPADTTPASTPPWTSPPQPLFCSYGVTTLDEAIKVVVEEDYYKTVLLEKTPGGWLTETGERYHEALLDSIRRLGYFPTLSCQAEHEKNPTAVNERYGIIEFFPSEHGFDNVAYFCGCYGDVLFCEIHVLDEEYVSVTSIIDYFIEALDTVPEDNGWRRIQLMRNGTIVPALCKESINGERNVIRFIEDGLYLSLSIASSLDSVAVAEAVEIIKYPLPEPTPAIE